MDEMSAIGPSQKASGRAIALGCVAALILVLAGAAFATSAPGSGGAYVQFTVNPGETSVQIARTLEEDGFIRYQSVYRLTVSFFGEHPVQPGGYYLSSTMDAFSVAKALARAPALARVVIPPGLRKEQIAALLSTALNWTSVQESEFIARDTDIDWTATPPVPDNDYFEGVYFPDTYLIPATSTPAQVAARLQDRFEEEFAPYAADALAQNIKWTTVLKVASLIQREAAGPQDMGLISGIIWNRLLAGMDLDIDSTVQYARGNTGAGWWAPLAPGDEQLNSPYNTYLNAGLPPTPIAEPGLDAIDAAIYPATTTCLYYLHDAAGQIHCSTTYQGQLDNIRTYLQS